MFCLMYDGVLRGLVVRGFWLVGGFWVVPLVGLGILRFWVYCVWLLVRFWCGLTVAVWCFNL